MTYMMEDPALCVCIFGGRMIEYHSRETADNDIQRECTHRYKTRRLYWYIAASIGTEV